MSGKIEEATEWLSKRRNCTLDMAFKDMRDSVDAYVGAGNAMMGDNKHAYPFQIEDGNGLKTRFVVRGFPFGSKNRGDNVTVEFTLTDNRLGM